MLQEILDQMIINKTNINTLEQLGNVANIVANNITLPSVVLLTGTLGSGKTTFAKFLISTISGCNIDIISPTFNILQIYEENNILIYHYDFYRLKSEMELVNLDLDYALMHAITIIEWPDIAKNFINSYLPKEKQTHLKLFTEDNKRFIQQII